MFIPTNMQGFDPSTIGDHQMSQILPGKELDGTGIPFRDLPRGSMRVAEGVMMVEK